MYSLVREEIGEGFTPIPRGDRGKAGLTFGILRLTENGRDHRAQTSDGPSSNGIPERTRSAS